MQGVTADVTGLSRCAVAMNAAARALGGIEILVNNTGIGAIGAVGDNPDDEWRYVFDVNVLGMVRTSRAALPQLRAASQRNGGAAIVNTCCVAATAGLPPAGGPLGDQGAAYSLTLAIAADYITDGIRVTCVCPGITDMLWIPSCSMPRPIQRLTCRAGRPPADWDAWCPRDEVAAAIV